MTGIAESQIEVFFRLARQCEGRSPLYAGLCRRFADDPAVGAIITSPPSWDTPLRLLNGLHYLVLTDRANWNDVDDALGEHREFLRRFVAEQTVQTNEVQRCWMLLPCFLEVARRTGATVFDLIELGPSAGLNLVWDQYRYRYGAGTWGPSGARLELSGEERRPIPIEVLEQLPRIRSRTGIDINPIDATSEEGALLLRSFVWADQTWRLEQLDRAIASLRADPPELMQGDLAELLPPLLDARPADSLTVIWQTAVLAYLPEERQKLVFDALRRAGERGPLAYIAATTPSDGSETYYGMRLQLWPADGRREELANVDFHGAWIEWLG